MAQQAITSLNGKNGKSRNIVRKNKTKRENKNSVTKRTIMKGIGTKREQTRKRERAKRKEKEQYTSRKDGRALRNR